jgi:hypothetical protein
MLASTVRKARSGNPCSPEDPSQHHVDGNLLVVLKADGVRSTNRVGIATEHSFEALPRLRLVP